MSGQARVLITGGAGFLGINLIRYLRERNIRDIRSLDLAPFDYPEKDEIDVLEGDIRDRDAVKRAVEDRTILVHTAAALPLYKKEEIHSTEVEGTKILLHQARESGVDRFIHISSTAVYGVPDHHPIYEDDGLVGVGDYGRAKILAERACLHFRNRGMCVPILRPKSFVGPERLGVFALLYDWAKDGRAFPMIGSGSNRYQLLDVEDLCQAIHLCMSRRCDRINDTFNVGAGEFGTMREDFQAVLDAAGFGKRIVPFPAWPAITALKVLELFHLSPLYKWVYETAFRDSFVSVDKAQRQMGYAPVHSNRDALLRNFQWYRENLSAFEGKKGITHRVPWKQGALGILKGFF